MSWLLEEIKLGPSSVPKAIRNIKDQCVPLVRKICENSRVVFIGSGSSYNAALPAAWLLNHFGYSAWVVQASDVNHFGPGFPDDAVPVLVSVSGNGEDILGAAGKVKDAFSVTNTKNAPLSELTRISLFMGLDSQKAEAATHTFLGSMGVLLWLAFSVLEEGHYTRQVVPGEGLKDSVRKVKEFMENQLAGRLESTFARSLEVMGVTSRKFFPGQDDNMKAAYRDSASSTANLALIGFGPSYSAALDGALKIKEVAQIFAEAHEGENVLHGPAYPIAYNKVPSIVLGSLTERRATMRTARILAGLGSNTLYVDPVVSESRWDGKDGVSGDWAVNFVEISPEERDCQIGAFSEKTLDQHKGSQMTNPGTTILDEALLPLASSIPLQVLAYFLGRERGMDLDVPPTKKRQREITQSLASKERMKRR